ncbi:MAG: UvrB/UvrC motif-containing protein, partial [Oscillospiraceae bacterium]
TIKKEIREILEISSKNDVEKKMKKKLSVREKQELIPKLTQEMKNAAKILEFEHAAYLRDRINKLKEELSDKGFKL